MADFVKMNGEEDPHNRTVLALVLRFLHDAGYEGAYSSLSLETNLSLEQVLR